MELRLKLSEARHALLSGNPHFLNGCFFGFDATETHAQCSDIDRTKHGFDVVFRSDFSIYGPIPKIESFTLRWDRHVFLSRYEVVRRIEQEGRMYFVISIGEREID